MQIYFLFIIFTISLILSFYSYKKLIPILFVLIPDKPTYRSSHQKITPTGGGLSFALIGSLGSFALGDLSQIFCLPLAFVGFLDDRFNISPFIRYFCQILTAILCLIHNKNFLLKFLNLSFPLNYISLIAIIIFITSIINFSNFMDGIDGLVGGCFVVIFLNMLLNGDTSLASLIGALIGFLILNWSPSRIFMGDAGSTYLGALFSFAIFGFNSMQDTLAYVLIAFPIIGDASICLIRRVFNKHQIFKPHKLHLYQRLHQAGWSHSKVSLIYIFSTFLLALAYDFGAFYYLLPTLFLLIIVGYRLESRYAIKFK